MRVLFAEGQEWSLINTFFYRGHVCNTGQAPWQKAWNVYFESMFLVSRVIDQWGTEGSWMYSIIIRQDSQLSLPACVNSSIIEAWMVEERRLPVCMWLYWRMSLPRHDERHGERQPVEYPERERQRLLRVYHATWWRLSSSRFLQAPPVTRLHQSPVL